MENNEDWVMRPVLAGMCLYESLENGRLGLFDVLRMNQALDVKEENEARALAAARRT